MANGQAFRSQYRFTLGGKTYEYRGHLSAADALLIKRHTGMTTLEMFAGLTVADPAAMVGVVFLAKRQAGERVTWDEVVEQIDGDDDIWALLDSMEPIAAEPPAKAPAEKSTRSRAKKEPDPAVA